MKLNTLITTSFALLLAACGGPKEIDQIAEAQNCLNTADPADAPACVSKVDGLESQSAYLIRCVGKFAKEGFNSPTKIAAALTNLSGGSGASGSTQMMAALSFTAETSASLNASSAQEALALCTQAKSKGLILLSGLSSTATTLASLGGLDPSTMTGAQLQTLMGTLASDPNATTAVGSAVISIYESNCSGTQETTGSFCEQFESAVGTTGTSDPAALGAQIMTCYNAPTTPGCSGF